MAYWCSVHEEGNLKIIWGTAPFRSTDSEERKAAWLTKYADRIKLNYEDKKGRRVVSISSAFCQFCLYYKSFLFIFPQPERRDKEQSEARAKKEEGMCRRKNHGGNFD